MFKSLVAVFTQLNSAADLQSAVFPYRLSKTSGSGFEHDLLLLFRGRGSIFEHWRRLCFMKFGAFIFSLMTTSAMAASDTVPPADDFGSPVALFVLAAVMLVLVGMGIVISLTFLACTAIFVGLGVISSSALVALFRRRFSSGLRALHYQLLALIGLPCGAGTLWLACSLFDVQIRQRYILAIGGAIGIVAGIIMALILDWSFRFVYHRFMSASGLRVLK